MKMKERVRLGVIGLGERGKVLLEGALLPMYDMDVEVCAVCDTYEDRIAHAKELIKEKTGKEVFGATDYREVLAMELDAVIISTAWEAHVEIALAAMKAGMYVGLEVGGVFAMEDCWRLVHTSEETGMPCMMLENCCYGKRELMILNMVKKGVFGDVIYCEGGYCHDLREEVAMGEENRHYRLRHYIHRNCDNYPTHELGPIAKILNINNGNRLMTLTSMATKAKSLHEYVSVKKGTESKLSQTEFHQGDIVKTMIQCANGELITLTLDTTLPRTYSRSFTIRGTKAGYWEDNDSIFLDGKHNEYEFRQKEIWDNASEYEEEYTHPLWKDFKPQGGHDGLDWMVIRAFVESIKAGVQTPIDVYDTAVWMAVSLLSEQSIAMGGAVQPIPDFTRGYWMNRKDIPKQKFELHDIYEV